MRRLGVALLVCMTVAVVFPLQSVTAEGPESVFTVDLHEIDVVQMMNKTGFLVVERMYLNNTSDSEYNGTLRSWLPLTARMIAISCPDPANQVMRRVNFNGTRCYDFSREVTDEELITFTPFEENDTLSYFGQEAHLTLNASNENETAWHSVPINVTVGFENLTRGATPLGVGLLINASHERMDARQTSVSQTRITPTQTFNITNESPWNETVSFSVDGLPSGWQFHVYNDTEEVSNMTLASNETMQLWLVVELPPHKLLVEFVYLLYVEPTGGDRKSVTWRQDFLYNVTEYSLWLFSRNESKISSPPTFVHVAHPLWQLPDWLHSIYIFDVGWTETDADFHEFFGTPSGGETLIITLEWSGASGEEFPTWILAAIVLIVVVLFILVFFWTKSLREVEEAPEEAEESKDRGADPNELLREAREAFAAGNISREFFERLEKKYEQELEETEEDPEIVALRDEKDRLLKAIKDLQRKLEDGRISESAYERLAGEYKKRAIEVMKTIDEREGQLDIR